MLLCFFLFLIILEITCKPLKFLKFGKVTPNSCTSGSSVFFGTQCNFQCNSANGFQIVGESSATCSVNGSWSVNVGKIVCKGELTIPCGYGPTSIGNLNVNTSQIIGKMTKPFIGHCLSIYNLVFEWKAHSIRYMTYIFTYSCRCKATCSKMPRRRYCQHWWRKSLWNLFMERTSSFWQLWREAYCKRFQWNKSSLPLPCRTNRCSL